MNFLKRLWKWRFVRVLAWLAGSVVSVYLLLCAWINYSGAKHWAAVQSMLQEERESLEFRSLLPAPVPEEKNFCAIPALKDLALMVSGDPDNKSESAQKRKRLEDTTFPTPKGPKPAQRPSFAAGASLGTPLDLQAWADWLRQDGSWPMPPASGNAARDVLAAFSKNDALFGELTAGLDRPETHWTPEWKNRELPEMLFSVPLPHFSAAHHVVSVLSMRAIAAARAGDAATAHQSLLVALRLTRASLADPFLIGTLVAAAQSNQIDHAVWELCDAHAGSAEDFRRLEEEIARLNFEAGLLTALRGEMAAGTGTVQWMKRHVTPEGYALVQNSTVDTREPGMLTWFLLKLIPVGLFDMNAAAIAETDFQYFIKPLREGGLRGCLDQTGNLDAVLKGGHPWYRADNFLAHLMTPTLTPVVSRATYTQCLSTQARAACALERWHIDHHEYPDSLAAVTGPDGKPLPVDPLSGKPMGYHKTPDRKYALWCVGTDEKDEGGTRHLKESDPRGTKFSDMHYEGDWVWSYQP